MGGSLDFATFSQSATMSTYKNRKSHELMIMHWLFLGLPLPAPVATSVQAKGRGTAESQILRPDLPSCLA